MAQIRFRKRALLHICASRGNMSTNPAEGIFPYTYGPSIAWYIYAIFHKPKKYQSPFPNTDKYEEEE